MSIDSMPIGAAYLDSSDFWTRVSERLGLKKPVTSEFDFFKAVHFGIGLKAIFVLKSEGLGTSEITVIIEPRTLSHRRAKRQSLSPEETERAARVSRMLTLVERVFGSSDKALAWLRKPQERLSGEKPTPSLRARPEDASSRKCSFRSTKAP